MNIYRRYFRVTKGPVVDEFKKIQSINSNAHKEYEKILSEIDANPSYYHIDNELVSIQFDTPPDSAIYKRVRSGWYPKKNCKAGKELSKRFSAVKTIPPSYTLKVIGLSSGPTIFSSGKCYIPTILDIPEEPTVIYISVPWYDEDPEKIAQYKIDRESGKCFNRNIDSILWEPSPDMDEIKKWEMDRHINEWNESVRAKKRG